VSWRTQYPFRDNFFDLSGKRMHYVDEGAGSPVLCVHGNPTWSFYYRALINHLKGRNRVIAVDHLGMGLSDRVGTDNYPLANHIDNLCRLVDHLQLEKATLVVHDWGGPIGLGMLAKRLPRFVRLVMLNTGAFPPKQIPIRLRIARSKLIGRFLLTRRNMFLTELLRTGIMRPSSLSVDERAGYVAPYDTPTNRQGVFAFVRDIPTKPTDPTWRTLAEIESSLTKISQLPTMMLWGLKDWVFTEQILNQMVTYFPNATVHRFPDAGHLVLEDERAACLKLIREFIDASGDA
jgi:cis-3-alkyl-4-acyloxetan-2-one decarboxylase